jgi:hypothetical protein
MQTKIASLGLIVICAVLALAAWVTSVGSFNQAEAITGTPQSISVIELQQGVDTKNLPVQQIADPI